MPVIKKSSTIDNLEITLELANNHGGSVEHALTIIKTMGAIVRKHGALAALKVQLRELGTFIHPAFRGSNTEKHIGRFESTRLTEAQFAEVLMTARAQGFITMATPFDEASVETLVGLDVEILKIASCSTQDWPLLERAVQAKKPMIVSTGGLSLTEINVVVEFLRHRGAHFALMHCVSIYPTPEEDLNLARIGELKRRYPGLRIGFSTHERPDLLAATQVACGMGADIYEWHVGVPKPGAPLNAYSLAPEQLDARLTALVQAKRIVGVIDPGKNPVEQADLRSLQRGVWLRRNVAAGKVIARDDVFFAMPLRPEQMTSGEFYKAGMALEATRDYTENAPLLESRVTNDTKATIDEIVSDMVGLFGRAGVPVRSTYPAEISCHFGLDRFREIGAFIVTCLESNVGEPAQYAQKIIAMLPGQKHPVHHHNLKHETFRGIWGVVIVILDGISHRLLPGETLEIAPGVKHSFWAEGPEGAVFEEIASPSTGVSIYENPQIEELPRDARKIYLDSCWDTY